MPEKSQLELVLEIFRASTLAQIAAGVVIGAGILLFILSWIGKLLKDLREILPAPEKSDKLEKADKQKGDENGDTQTQRDEIFAMQAELIDDQRALIKMIVASTVKVKSLDDTIPMRDDLLDKLNDESNQIQGG